MRPKPSPGGREGGTGALAEVREEERRRGWEEGGEETIEVGGSEGRLGRSVPVEVFFLTARTDPSSPLPLPLPLSTLARGN